MASPSFSNSVNALTSSNCRPMTNDPAEPLTRARGPGAPLTELDTTWLTTPEVCRQARKVSSSATVVRESTSA